METTYEPVIGLEVHIQLGTASKLFCSCPTEFGAKENTQVCPVCCGYPGSLPVLNKQALVLALKMAIGLHCAINRTIIFERKHYFYPDLPKNYQISQYALPLGHDGFLTIDTHGVERTIRITRVHMEEDAGKLVHGETASYVDFNRTGIPLVEVVTYPDIASPEEAYVYLSELKLFARYLGVSECDMEKGFLRCDANVSVREKGQTRLGTKIELKNMNSFKGVRDALSYEIQRQVALVGKGETIVQSTRLWDENVRKTSLMRAKEEAHDYHYFPDPDLAIFEIEDALITTVKDTIPASPKEIRLVLGKNYGLSDTQIEVLMQDPLVVHFFIETAALYADAKKIYNVISVPLFECMHAEGRTFSSVKLSPERLAKLIRMAEEGLLNNLTTKEVLRRILFTDEDPREVAEALGILQVSGEEALIGSVDKVIAGNPKAVHDVAQGREQAVMFLVGQVMREMKGKANPKVLRELFERRIRDDQSAKS